MHSPQEDSRTTRRARSQGPLPSAPAPEPIYANQPFAQGGLQRTPPGQPQRQNPSATTPIPAPRSRSTHADPVDPPQGQALLEVTRPKYTKQIMDISDRPPRFPSASERNQARVKLRPRLPSLGWTRPRPSKRSATIGPVVEMHHETVPDPSARPPPAMTPTTIPRKPSWTSQRLD
jgi:hypothetical protein